MNWNRHSSTLSSNIDSGNKFDVIRVYGEPHYRTDIGCGAKETPTSTLIIKTT